MKILITTLVALQFVSLLSMAESGKPLPVFEKLQAGKKQTVIVYGTSLTAEGEWAKEMKRWFDQKYPGKVTFLNSGGSGMNSDWGLTNLENKVLKHQPALVFVEFSYNDAHEKFKLTTDKAAENLAGIITGIQKGNPETTIVLQVMNIPWDAPNGKESKTLRPKLDDFNANYLAAAKERRLPFVNHQLNWAKLLEEDPEKYHGYVPDGTHPTKEASLAVTWPALRAWLEEAADLAAKTK